MLSDDELNERSESESESKSESESDELSSDELSSSEDVEKGLSLLGSVNENDGSESLIGITVRVFGLS